MYNLKKHIISSYLKKLHIIKVHKKLISNLQLFIIYYCKIEQIKLQKYLKQFNKTQPKTINYNMITLCASQICIKVLQISQKREKLCNNTMIIQSQAGEAYLVKLKKLLKITIIQCMLKINKKKYNIKLL